MYNDLVVVAAKAFWALAFFILHPGNFILIFCFEYNFVFFKMAGNVSGIKIFPYLACICVINALYYGCFYVITAVTNSNFLKALHYNLGFCEEYQKRTFGALILMFFVAFPILIWATPYCDKILDLLCGTNSFGFCYKSMHLFLLSLLFLLFLLILIKKTMIAYAYPVTIFLMYLLVSMFTVKGMEAGVFGIGFVTPLFVSLLFYAIMFVQQMILLFQGKFKN